LSHQFKMNERSSFLAHLPCRSLVKLSPSRQSHGCFPDPMSACAPWCTVQWIPEWPWKSWGPYQLRSDLWELATFPLKGRAGLPELEMLVQNFLWTILLKLKKKGNDVTKWLLLKFTSGKFANLEQSFAISSWIIDSMLAFPKPKSFKFFSKNLLCSLQYWPLVPITPGFRPSFSLPTNCQPGLDSLIGGNGGRDETSSRLKSSVWEFTKLLIQICNIFCNFKLLLQSNYPLKINSLCFIQ